MGLESSVYFYSRPSGMDLDELLAKLDLIPLDPTTGKYRVNVQNCWIDILARGSLNIRLAYTNPKEVVEKELRDFLLKLLSLGGAIRDPQTRTTFLSMDDSDWNLIWQEYLSNRERFVKHYGNVVLPISGEDVFQYILGPDREGPGSN